MPILRKIGLKLKHSLTILLINSGLEILADRITLEYDELIGRAKDIGSAGVFIALTQVTLILGTVLYLTFF
jgi:diacylglycerol kinase (ATP)